jgi:hypothetical protein
VIEDPLETLFLKRVVKDNMNEHPWNKIIGIILILLILFLFFRALFTFIGYWIFLIVAILVIWIVYKTVRDNRIDNKYHISRNGGRSGFLLYENSGKKAKIEFEMLSGKFHFILWDKDIEWIEPTKEKYTENEKEIFYKALESWALERKLKYKLETIERS